jgi:hypothetical protein
MSSGKTLQTTIAIGGKLLPSFNNAFGAVNSQMIKVNASAAYMAKQNAKLANTYANLGYAAKTAAVGIVVGAAAMVKNGIQLTSDLAESQNVVSVTFGKSESSINKWAKTAQGAYGLSKLAAKQYTGTMGAMLKSTGIVGNEMLTMSTNLAGLSGDFASFYNLDTDTAFEKIRSGISGETEPLKQLGINMSETNLKAFALSKGIKASYSSMNEASKTALRYAYLMEVSKDAQGDFKRTSDGFANQQRLLKLNTDNVSMTLSTGLVPVLAKMFKLFNDKLQNVDMSKVAAQITAFGTSSFDAISKVINFTTTNWPLIKAALQGVAAYLVISKVAMIGFMAVVNAGKIIGFIGSIGSFISALSKIRTSVGLATAVQSAWNTAMIANPIGVAVMSVAALGAAIYVLYKNWDKVVSFFKSSWETVKGIFGGTSEASISANTKASRTATAGMRRYANGGFASVPSIFGEAGPEAAIPLNKSPKSLSLLNRTAEILGVRGGSITFAPIISVDGGKGDVEGQVRNGIKAAYPGFENMVHKFREGREAYA